MIRKMGRTLPLLLLCAGVMTVLEMVHQLNQFDVIGTIRGHEIWNYIGFGVVVLYILPGTLAGWLASVARDRYRSGGREGRVS